MHTQSHTCHIDVPAVPKDKSCHHSILDHMIVSDGKCERETWCLQTVVRTASTAAIGPTVILILCSFANTLIHIVGSQRALLGHTASPRLTLRVLRKEL